MQSCIPGGGEVRPVLRQLTSQAPIITQIDGLLTPAECDALVQSAEKAGFQPSRTGGFRGEERTSAHRTSRTSYLPEDDPVVACVGRRLATVAAMPWGGLEPLQATRYTIGQQYQSHHDAPTGSRGRQRRLKTIFAYLQADGDLPAGKCGGATRFDRLRQQDGTPLQAQQEPPVAPATPELQPRAEPGEQPRGIGKRAHAERRPQWRCRAHRREWWWAAGH